MHVAVLTIDDAPRYRELMLEAYVHSADAFTSTAQERELSPMSWWADRIAAASGLTQGFGAFEAGQLVGSVALEYSAKPKTRHAGQVIGMYVRPAARRLGAGRALMQAALAAAAARPGLLKLQLSATEGNAAAIRLYESLGFSTWGVEPMAILTPSGYQGKVYMAMPLPGAGTGVPGAHEAGPSSRAPAAG